MILYFSATGNSKYVATRIAQAIGQNIVSIAGIGNYVRLYVTMNVRMIRLLF